jgi:hypothetical protein
MYTKWRDAFGQADDDVLCVQGSSQTFNPLLDAKAIAAAKLADPEASEAEWEGGFRQDISAFLSDEVIAAAIVRDRPLELSPQLNTKYRGFVDMSGGRHDASTLCIGHLHDGKFIADAIRGQVRRMILVRSWPSLRIYCGPTVSRWCGGTTLVVNGSLPHSDLIL